LAIRPFHSGGRKNVQEANVQHFSREARLRPSSEEENFSREAAKGKLIFRSVNSTVCSVSFI